ncbi:DUF2141 domain-containing protein [Dokdonia sp. Hel_I_53]|uniref:DUF2141 domain-containing protein n=1 Tax=Dokdonia sp. Hel_I_53 TaxID=1566287 RepID=UPI00119A7959|nr:DUF2141 domain-containing protein [Dokdonia sp. Hel_I_53]TVZ51548.1 uncharacterized protein (DUF2141 family) [Dokdonia sp. Hel_I_53]
MKTIIFLVLAIVSGLSFGQNENGVTLTITIPNLSNNDGEASAALYNEATFMKAAPLQTSAAIPKNNAVTLVFENVKPGAYGIITLHDTNGNGRMDFEANGMPKEDYGVSGSGAGFGPPSWSNAEITVGKENMDIEIRM